jgi:hypothetical protein
VLCRTIVRWVYIGLNFVDKDVSIFTLVGKSHVVSIEDMGELKEKSISTDEVHELLGEKPSYKEIRDMVRKSTHM